MKKVQLSESLIVAYMILSSAAFIAYFGLGVWASSPVESKFQRGKWQFSWRNRTPTISIQQRDGQSLRLGRASLSTLHADWSEYLGTASHD